MVLSIEAFRSENGHDVNFIYESEKKRFSNEKNVDLIIDYDKKWRKADFYESELRKLLNQLNKKCIKPKMIELKEKNISFPEEFGVLPKKLQEKELSQISVDELLCLSLPECIEFKKYLEKEINEAHQDKVHLNTSRLNLLRTIGNIIHDSVPVSNDEANNEVIKTFGSLFSNYLPIQDTNTQIGDCQREELHSHRDLIVMIDGVELEKGSHVSGSRGYYLKGPAVLLEYALIQYSLHFLLQKGYIPLSPPLTMKKEIMQEVAQLSQFEEELYQISNEAYLIATSEQPIAAFHRGETFSEQNLKTPIRYVGISNCFRKEAGSHGRDMSGIFRVHQFQKVEQFVIVSPENNESWIEMENMISNSEQFFQSLNIPYRIVNIVSGELNLAASKKYDLEGWFPGSKAFRELVSCSNCTDYQSRSLKIKFSPRIKSLPHENHEYVHMLNSTLCATTRTICALLECNQTENGINIPEVLRPYFPKEYSSHIPFIKAPI